MSEKLETATLGGGCFWCTEAVFQQLRGVQDVTSGYCGGQMENPTYEQVCSGTTGHAEAIQLTFDPAQISFRDVLQVFMKTHDPTTLNRQGNDVGTQYRSAIFYHSPQQEQTANEVIEELNQSGEFGAPIVTEVVPVSAFFSAEAYHQNFYRRNPNQPYCAIKIPPKLQKLQSAFGEYCR